MADWVYDKYYSECAFNDEDLSSDLPSGVMAADSYDYKYSTHEGINSCGFIITNGESYFVKYPASSDASDGAKERESDEITVELFVSFIAKKIGIDCVDVKLFVDNLRGSIGLASKNFGEHFTFADLGCTGVSVGDMLDSLEKRFRQDRDVVLDKEYLREGLNKMVVFDYLIGQADRHGGNFAFQIKKVDGKKKLVFTPLYDNAFSFEQSDWGPFHLPDGYTVRGVGEQVLLTSTYKDMFDKFSDLFSAENFPKIKQEFEETYKIRSFIPDEHYDRITERIQRVAQNNIQFCKVRSEKQEILPITTILAVFNKHMNDMTYEDKQSFFSSVKNYYGNLFNGEGYSSFLSGKSGFLGLATWEYYDECVELAKQPESQEFMEADKLLGFRKREIEREVLTRSLEGEVGFYNSEEKLKHILFGEKLPRLERKYAPKEEVNRQRSESYKKLREWAFENKGEFENLNEEERTELNETIDLLKDCKTNLSQELGLNADAANEQVGE